MREMSRLLHLLISLIQNAEALIHESRGAFLPDGLDRQKEKQNQGYLHTGAENDRLTSDL